MHIRFADPGDAAACLAVYAQYIDTSITFETVLPSEAEFSGRIRSYGAVYPWLIAEELQKQGVRTAYGVVTMPNDASSALHQKLGFRTLGTYHNTGYKNGRWLDVVWFEKPIGSFTDEPRPLVPITRLPDAAAILAAANT